MAGLYIHIPFCKQACHYCNFYFSTSSRFQNDYVQALLQEIDLSTDYLPTNELETVYLGGGTPSLLSEEQLKHIFTKIDKHYRLSPDAEITLEANPDDLTNKKLRVLANSPVNRLSIGVQSFIERDLQYMQRAHNAEEAQKCIQLAQQHGFSNLTVDLIYGTPGLSDAEWRSNLQHLIELAVPHISAYALTVEEGTALQHLIRKGKSKPVDEEQSARQFEIMLEVLNEAGYRQYEISNFAKPGHESRHNSAYWQRKRYLGLGPSAHSYNGNSRRWNIANVKKYIDALAEGKLLFEKEALSTTERYNEYIMTGLRTIWGVDLAMLKKDLGEAYALQFEEEAAPYLADGLLQKTGSTYNLTPQGKLLADRIASQLFMVEE